MPDYLIPAIVNEGFYRNDIVDGGVTDLCYIPGRIIGKGGFVAVFIGDLRGFIEAVIASGYGIAFGIGFFDDIIAIVIFIRCGIAVFVGIFYQQAVAIILAGTLFAVSVRHNPFVVFVGEFGCKGIEDRIFLLDYTTVSIIDVFETTDPCGVNAGFHPAAFVIRIGQHITACIKNEGEMIAGIGQACLSSCIIVNPADSAIGIFFEIHFLTGYAVGDCDHVWSI